MAHVTRLFFCGIRRLNPSEPFGGDSNNDDYHFSAVNIFIGENGGGKSTVLDLIDTIREPSRLVTLPRENKRSTDKTYFSIEFENGARLKGTAHSNPIEAVQNASNIKGKSPIDVLSLGLGIYGSKGDFRAFSKNVCKSELDAHSHSELKILFAELGVDVQYWDSQSEPSPTELVECLNLAASAFPGILSPVTKDINDSYDGGTLAYKRANPFHTHEYDDGRLRVWLSDDTHQKNHVHLTAIPSGWRRIASIFTWLKKLPKGAICLIEEPEIHLHPKLQRYLAVMMESMVKKNSLQLFIATHSTVFQQPNLWKTPPSIFLAEGSSMEAHPDAWKVMEALGVRGSDLSQSNGIIWVEGPSDRIYIKYWLELFCKKYKFKVPKENVDYSFNLYGGAVLSHMSVTESKSFISMLKINRNFVLVMDRDNDFRMGNGVLHPKNPSSTKARILNEIKSIARNHVKVWVTDKYTIESYLPVEFRKRYFSISGSRRLALLKTSKMTIARTYLKQFSTFEKCSDIKHKLEPHIANLHNSILSWNHEDFPLWSDD